MKNSIDRIIQKINKALPDNIPPMSNNSNEWLLVGNETKKEIDRIRIQYIEHIKEQRQRIVANRVTT